MILSFDCTRQLSALVAAILVAVTLGSESTTAAQVDATVEVRVLADAPVVWLLRAGDRVALPATLQFTPGQHRLTFLRALGRRRVALCLVNVTVGSRVSEFLLSWADQCVGRAVRTLDLSSADGLPLRMYVDGRRRRSSLPVGRIRLAPGRHTVLYRSSDGRHEEQVEVVCDQSRACVVVSTTSRLTVPRPWRRARKQGVRSA